jgi:ribosomal 50S subunit-associated protein YjgA (DUF615 family)
MRKVDIEPIQEQLDKIKAKSAHATRELHQLERWRERLLSDQDVFRIVAKTCNFILKKRNEVLYCK